MIALTKPGLFDESVDDTSSDKNAKLDTDKAYQNSLIEMKKKEKENKDLEKPITRNGMI